MDKETKKEFESLASMVARGFEHADDQVKNQFGEVGKRLDHLDARMGRMEADLNEIRGNIVYRHEFEDLEARVKYLETKLGIQSGK